MVKVLIAEDNVPISVHLSNVINFTKEAHAISIVNNGTEVYQTIKTLKPEIVILDLKLPGEDGLEILRKIEENSKETKVIIYSGEPEYIAKVRGYESVVNFFSKTQPCEAVGVEVQRIAREISFKYKEDKIYDILFKLGFQPSQKGTEFIKDCIEISIKEHEENLKKIYQRIAIIKGKKAYTIKADVQVAVHKMWKYANEEKVRKFLRLGDYEEPSAKNVVTMVKYYVAK